MILQIIDINFTTTFNWLYRLTDNTGVEYFVMNDSFYRMHGFKSPVTKKELDTFDIKQSVDCHYESIDGKNIVTKFK